MKRGEKKKKEKIVRALKRIKAANELDSAKISQPRSNSQPHTYTHTDRFINNSTKLGSTCGGEEEEGKSTHTVYTHQW